MLRTLLAQVGAETRTRLRSGATIVATLALLAASFLWIPDPASGAVSISWRDAQKHLYSGFYNSAYVGAASGILSSIFLSLIGFYLVIGSVRRDRESGIGAILAATPLANAAYLLGKWASHFAYLLTLASLSALSGVLVFLRYGSGPFVPGAFLVPALLLAAPTLALTAALAVLFDVTPGLRGRGGLIAWFFAWIIIFLALPGDPRPKPGSDPARTPLYDPAGVVTFVNAVASASGADVQSISLGVEVYDEPLTRVEWTGLDITPRFVAARLLAAFWLLPPLALALFFFDRFDPARAPRSRAGAAWLARLAGRFRGAPVVDAGNAARAITIRPVPVTPSTWRAVVAEARLLWDDAGWLRWPLLAAALGGLVAPAAATPVFLLLLAPALSEAAAREDLTGSRGLVFSQPSLPASPLAWKLSAAVLFVLVLGLPAILRGFLDSPARGFALATGLVFVAAWATSAGSLSRGGKLFSGSYVALWYTSLNAKGAALLDFCGISGAGTDLRTRTLYATFACVMLAAAWLVERHRLAFDSR